MKTVYCTHIYTYKQNFILLQLDSNRFTNILIWHKSTCDIKAPRQKNTNAGYYFCTRHHCRSQTMFACSNSLVAWSLCHLGDVDLGGTAAEIDTTCPGGGCGWKNDSADLPCPECFSQPSMAFLSAWRQGSCSFGLLGLVLCVVFACCRALLHILITFNEQTI